VRCRGPVVKGGALGVKRVPEPEEVTRQQWYVDRRWRRAVSPRPPSAGSRGRAGTHRLTIAPGHGWRRSPAAGRPESAAGCRDAEPPLLHHLQQLTCNGREVGNLVGKRVPPPARSCLPTLNAGGDACPMPQPPSSRLSGRAAQFSGTKGPVACPRSRAERRSAPCPPRLPAQHDADIRWRDPPTRSRVSRIAVESPTASPAGHVSQRLALVGQLLPVLPDGRHCAGGRHRGGHHARQRAGSARHRR
jgi:hypothetical protein